MKEGSGSGSIPLTNGYGSADPTDPGPDPQHCLGDKVVELGGPDVGRAAHAEQQEQNGQPAALATTASSAAVIRGGHRQLPLIVFLLRQLQEALKGAVFPAVAGVSCVLCAFCLFWHLIITVFVCCISFGSFLTLLLLCSEAFVGYPAQPAPTDDGGWY